MDNYKRKLRKIEDKLFAIERHLVSEIALDRSFEDYLLSIRSSLRLQQEVMMKQYDLIANAPIGDIDSPETIESDDLVDSPERLEKKIVNIFSKKTPAVHQKTKSMLRYPIMPSKLNLSKSELSAQNEMRPSIDIMSTQTEFSPNSDSEILEHSSILVQSADYSRQTPNRSVISSEEDLFHTLSLIGSISGVNQKNVRSVLRSFKY